MGSFTNHCYEGVNRALQPFLYHTYWLLYPALRNTTSQSGHRRFVAGLSH
jgi:hypothetical protein